MRSIWKGHIRFSLVTIPIELYNAVNSSSSISFRQLHKKDNGRVGYNKVCRTCDEVLSKDEIIKGFEYEPDQYAIIEPEDIDNIKLKSNKIIEIEAFIPTGEIHPLQYEAPYFVAPGGEIAKKSYVLLQETLKRTGKSAIGRIILRDREDVVLITPDELGLMIYKLRFPYEMRNFKDVPDLDLPEPEEDQVKLAETLVASLSKNVAEIDFEDRFRDAIMEMVDAKTQGKEVVRFEDDEDQPVVDIMSALKASIEKAKQKKSA